MGHLDSKDINLELEELNSHDQFEYKRHNCIIKSESGVLFVLGTVHGILVNHYGEYLQVIKLIEDDDYWHIASDDAFHESWFRDLKQVLKAVYSLDFKNLNKPIKNFPIIGMYEKNK